MSDSDEPDLTPENLSARAVLWRLVVLPGLAVALVVTVSVWAISPQNDVDSLLKRLDRPGRDRWVAALNLAAMLHKPGNEQLKRDPAVARQLADLLRKETKTSQDDNDSVNMQVYLCRALREFHIAEPLPVLIEAARPRETADDTRVRRAAIEAVAVLASHVGPAKLRSDATLLPCLLHAAGDQQHTVRLSAAFALGVVGGDRAETALVTMLVDEQPEVRYNAATGLARHGNTAAVDVLCEMLDPKRAAGNDLRETLIPLNALRAVEQLAAANPRADLKPLRHAVAKLSDGESGAEIRAEIRVKATDVLRQLERHVNK